MKLVCHTPKKILNKAFLKQRPLRADIELFKANLLRLFGKINEIEREENQKNHLRDFLINTLYPNNEINTKDNKDLVIHLGKSNADSVGVIIEAKRPTNKSEMIDSDKPNAKALHELILYYFDERETYGNNELKNLIATNVYRWFIFDANCFDKLFYRNTAIKNLYRTYVNDGKDTAFFYEEISKILPNIDSELNCAYFDIRDYEKFIKNDDAEDDKNLIALFKILSEYHLLKVPFADDSNKLDSGFYRELLHIIGLEETKDSGKIVIRRKKENRDSGSIIENTINILETDDVIFNLPDVASYGESKEEKLFNVALELAITWINRILFLKLLEAQLVAYHEGDKSYRFLHSGLINDFDELYKLFHQVLARNIADRSNEVKQKYAHVPYLNSSLFEISELERQTLKINSLDNSATIALLNGSVLKNSTQNALPALEYLFKFLEAYDFASEGSEDIQEESKTIINASVLGKVFEKINGYKDGSIFTPGFITMYMCRESIRPAVVQKFRDRYGWNLNCFDDIKNYIADRRSAADILEFNQTINSLRLCDPAVGSGHFLVSALNELIAVKYELGILADSTGTRVRDFELTIENDELIVTNESGDLFEYRVRGGRPIGSEAQRLQKTLFHEKQNIIENCLFGVDINPKSVLICRLRLWIELLKNAYYREESGFRELETLPNIDINIKCGNSLISRYALDADIKTALKKSKWTIDSYRLAVMTYRNAHSKDEKREMQRLIDTIKSDFVMEISANDKRLLRKKRLEGDLFDLTSAQLFEMGKAEKSKWEKQVKKLGDEIRAIEAELEEVKSNRIYHNAFEWRFEFPEVLNDDGDFIGFDAVIGNPPYIRQESIKTYKPYLQKFYTTYTSASDIYVYFVEKAFQIIKEKGEFSFIMPNKWMQANYGKPLREFILKYQLHSIIDFGDLQVFDEATTYPCIINIANEEPNNYFSSIILKTLDFEEEFEHYVNLNKHKLLTNAFSTDTWYLGSNDEQIILNKAKSNSLALKQYIQSPARYGLKTGLTQAFVVSNETKNTLVEQDPKSIDLLKPFLLGRDLKPYTNPEINQWLILIPKGFTIKTNIKEQTNMVHEPVPRYGYMPDEEAWYWLKSNYPAVAKYLQIFKAKAEKRTDKGDFWWELRACDYYDVFEKPKIMYQSFQVKSCFIYDTSGMYCNNSMWIIPSDDKALLGLLNSKMAWWLIGKYCTAIQNGYQLIWDYFSQIPIPQNFKEKSQPLEKLVTKILALKQADAQTDTSALEAQIDRLVYELYGLTEEEIKIVEGE